MKLLPESALVCLESTLVSENNLLAINSLSVSFGGLKALDNVSIEVKPNNVVALIGPNGAGKTTLFNAISGLVTADSGQIKLEDNLISWPKPHELAGYGIARTLQGVGLFSGLSVVENVMMGADIHRKSNFIKDILGLSSRDEYELKEKAMQALAWAGAAHLAELEPKQLTYPDSKRVSIARALVMMPKILLLDEPAAGLGQDDIDKFTKLIFDLKRNCSIVIVEHHIDFISRISDQVYVLNFGKVIASGTFDSVKREPAVLDAYLGTQQSNSNSNSSRAL
jgi:branched-chain amino acid transport system ATP-binding protein